MRYDPDEIIENKKYQHVFTLAYNDIIPFVLTYVKKYTLPLFIFICLLLFSFVWLLIIFTGIAGNYPFITIVGHTMAGLILIPVLLVIPHEFLHIIPYYLAGARKISIGAEWKQYYFFVTADKFPVTAPVFITVALSPFVIINIALILLGLHSSPLWQYTLLSSLFAHITMCAGDLALINFYYLNRNKKIITWDNVSTKEAYFYEYNPGAETK